MPQNRDLATLLDVERAAQKIVQFKQGLNQQGFLEDEKSQSAIIFQLLVIGKATKRLSMKLREDYPDIPWPLMAGM